MREGLIWPWGSDGQGEGVNLAKARMTVLVEVQPSTKGYSVEHMN